MCAKRRETATAKGTARAVAIFGEQKKMDNDVLIARFQMLIDMINKELEKPIDISDIPDETYTEDDLAKMISANVSLLNAVKQRHTVIELVADRVIARNKGTQA